VSRYRQVSPLVSRHSGATQIRLASKNSSLIFLISFERGDNWRRLCLDHTNNLFLFQLDHSDLNKSKMITYMSYRHYSPAPSGRLRETEEGTCNTSESEATRTRVQRASTSSFVKLMLHLDMSTLARPLALGNATHRQPTQNGPHNGSR
jgi:hypothetical protein